jgi:RNase adaptor protein for sRNA GlmZ degradation
MSSNSLAVMPRPRYETWFMEGRLIPNYHYVEIKTDYSDLADRLTYYIRHVDEALQIIENAHQYIAQFRDKKREDIISLLTLQKYFIQTGQLK